MNPSTDMEMIPESAPSMAQDQTVIASEAPSSSMGAPPSTISASKINIHAILNPPEDDEDGDEDDQLMMTRDDSLESTSFPPTPLATENQGQLFDDEQSLPPSPSPAVSEYYAPTPKRALIVQLPPTPPIGVASTTSSSHQNITSEDPTQKPRACVHCRKACKKCDKLRPCGRCARLGLSDSCIDSPRAAYKKRGPKPGSKRVSKSPSVPASPSSSVTRTKPRRGRPPVSVSMSKTASSTSSIRSFSSSVVPQLVPPTDDSDDLYSPLPQHHDYQQQQLMIRDPPSLESLPETVNTAIRMEVLSCVEPNWTKFDILARLCQSVLVHQESVEGDTYRQPGADAVIDGGATVGSNHHGVGSSVEQQVDLIVQGLMAKVFDIAESGSSSRKRGLSISGDEQMPFPKHIAV